MLFMQEAIKVRGIFLHSLLFMLIACMIMQF
jgi:hypothetical protein